MALIALAISLVSAGIVGALLGVTLVYLQKEEAAIIKSEFPWHNMGMSMGFLGGCFMLLFNVSILADAFDVRHLHAIRRGVAAGERLRPRDRDSAIADLMALRVRYPKLKMPKGLIEAYAEPPQSPEECVFAQTTLCVSADLSTKIAPCQFGGVPDCSSCGLVSRLAAASA